MTWHPGVEWTREAATDENYHFENSIDVVPVEAIPAASSEV